MATDLIYQEKFTFQASVEVVYDALWAGPGGKFLEIHHIAGQPGNVGHEQQVRCAYGGVDLLMIETITAATRPSHLRVTQRPDGLRRADPNERDIPFLDSVVEDLDAAFTAQFGTDPATTQIEYDLKQVGEETHVQIVVSTSMGKRLGWLRSRRWRKIIKKDVADIVSGINSRI